MEEDLLQQPQNLPPHRDRSDVIKKAGAFIWEFLKIVIVAAIIVLPIRYWLFQPFIVKGESMIPNFQDGNYLIIDEISYRFKAPERGDVIVLKPPLDMSQRYIKRIIGLPGETVEIKNGNVDILKDGKEVLLDENTYLPNLLSTSGDKHVTLGPDEYYVLGDNRPYSFDSRGWGTLPRENIIGKVIFRVFPLGKMSYITHPNY